MHPLSKGNTICRQSVFFKYKYQLEVTSYYTKACKHGGFSKETKQKKKSKFDTIRRHTNFS